MTDVGGPWGKPLKNKKTKENKKKEKPGPFGLGGLVHAELRVKGKRRVSSSRA
jgi:hypothetical protein